MGMPRILSGRFQHIGTRECVLISAIYGPHTPGEKEVFLQNIGKLNQLHNEKLWLIGGDFNMITSLAKKKWGIRRHELEMEWFRTMQADLHLVEIPTINGIHTWDNRRGGVHQVTSQLDRFLASEYLINRDIYYEALILPCMGFNH